MLRYVLVAASALQATADTTACAAALADMANPQSANVAKHSLAAFTSANVAAAGGAFAGWPTGETYGFLLAQHMSDFGDPDACEAIGGYRFFGVQYAFGQMGLCLPRVCDVEDLNDFRAVLPLAPSKIVSGRFRFRLGVGGGLMIALALLLVMMALVATVFEPQVIAHAKGQEDYVLLHNAEYPGPPWLRCFSLVKNYDAWLGHRARNALSCLDGVRVLSMLMVIHGHTLLLAEPTFTNLIEAVLPPHGLMSTARGQALLADEFAVDSFFWLSGLLATRALVAYASTKRGFAWVPQTYLFRYLRLTPLYGFVLLFWWKALRVVGMGPLWLSRRGAYRNCQEHWWTNLLYVNNLVPFKTALADQCFGHGWYLADDMQFFLLLPLFVVAHSFRRRTGYAALFVGFWASITYSLWAAGRFDLSANVFDGSPQFEDYYVRPWTRIPPYLVGAATALLLRDFPFKPPRLISAVMRFVALFILGLCYFGAYPFYQGDDIKTPQGLKHLNHSYVALSKPAWAVALTLLCWPSFHGHRGMIGRVLELRLWEPLAKLTYAMYLVHPPVLEVMFKARRGGRVSFSETWWGFSFLAVASATGLVAVGLHLLVELPFANLVGLLRKRVAAPARHESDALAELAEPLTEPASAA